MGPKIQLGGFHVGLFSVVNQEVISPAVLSPEAVPRAKQTTAPMSIFFQSVSNSIQVIFVVKNIISRLNTILHHATDSNIDKTNIHCINSCDIHLFTTTSTGDI